MGIQTRSFASNSPAKVTNSSTSKVILSAADEEPLKIFVLPAEISRDSRFLLLRNPRDGAKSRYIFCPCSGLFEITKVGFGALDPRSVLFTPDARESTGGRPADAELIEQQPNITEAKFEGYTNKVAEVFVATCFDPAFLLLPILDRSSANERLEHGKGLFQPVDDLLDEAVGDDTHARHVMTNEMFRPKLVDAIDQVCDAVDVADERMYRLNLHKLCGYILAKARAVVQKGLPASLEDRFVTRTLDLPTLSVRRNECAVSTGPGRRGSDPECQFLVESESQSTTTISAIDSMATEVSTSSAVRSVGYKPSADVHHLQRLRTALSFITASYLDTGLAAKLTAIISDGEGAPDFRPLDEYLQHLSKLRAEALATRSLSDFRKRRTEEVDEAAIERAEKRKKLEDEEKKKKTQESRGVRDLKKTNVSGMKKMSEFFAKKL